MATQTPHTTLANFITMLESANGFDLAVEATHRKDFTDVSSSVNSMPVDKGWNIVIISTGNANPPAPADFIGQIKKLAKENPDAVVVMRSNADLKMITSVTTKVFLQTSDVILGNTTLNPYKNSEAEDTLIYRVGANSFTYDSLQKEYPLLLFDPKWSILFTGTGKHRLCHLSERVMRKEYTPSTISKAERLLVIRIAPVIHDPGELRVVAINDRPGVYRVIGEGFLVRQEKTGAIIAIGIEVNGVLRPLTDEEKVCAIQLGIIVEDPTLPQN